MNKDIHRERVMVLQKQKLSSALGIVSTVTLIEPDNAKPTIAKSNFMINNEISSVE